MQIIFQKTSGLPLPHIIQQATSSTYSVTDIWGNTITFDNKQEITDIREWTTEDYEQMVSLTVG